MVLLTAVIAGVVSLTTGDPVKGAQTGAKASYAVVHYGLVSLGIVSSFGDEVGPSYQSGRDLGDQQSGQDKAAVAAAPKAKAPKTEKSGDLTATPKKKAKE